MVLAVQMLCTCLLRGSGILIADIQDTYAISMRQVLDAGSSSLGVRKACQREFFEVSIIISSVHITATKPLNHPLD